MPQHVARPVAPGSASEWDPVGAATLWEAWANELHSSYATAILADRRGLVAFEPLPAEAVSVSRVTILGLAAGDDVATLRFLLYLAGVESLGATLTPPDGGYVSSEDAFDLAPGGLAWTVARRNALEGGPLSVFAPFDAGRPLNVDSLRLVTDYESATETVETEGAAGSIRIEGSAVVSPVSGSALERRVVGGARASTVTGTHAPARVDGSARVVGIAGVPPDA